MEIDSKNFDGDFLCDLLTSDAELSGASFLREESLLDQTYDKARGQIDTLETVLCDIPPNLSTACISSIHTGDTDSSDDDDNRNQLDSNLNSYGKSIKSSLPKENQVSEAFYSENRRSWSTKNDTVLPKSRFSGPVIARSACDDSVDPVFHIRISERVISTTVLQERMKGRLAISMDGLKRFTDTGDKESDWVLAGAIVFKSPVKTSQKGAKYAIWRISDLKPGLKTASIFLFRSAFKDLWKTAVGTVVGILNPAIIDNRDGSGDEAALSIDLAQKVMVLGKSKDYALCKSTKKNGDRCGVFVNKSDCDVCVYHVQTEYRKCARRSELQSTAPRTPTLRNKVLGKNEVFYAGKSFTSVVTGRNRNHVTKDRGTLQRLNGLYVTPGLNKPTYSQEQLPSSAKRNQELGLNGDHKNGCISKSNTVNLQERRKTLDALKSMGTHNDELRTRTPLASEKNVPKPEECTFLLAESVKDNEESFQNKISKVSFENTKNLQRVAMDPSNRIIPNSLEPIQAVNIETKICRKESTVDKNPAANLSTTKKQTSDTKIMETKLKRTNTSISQKAIKVDLEPSFLGLASRLGVGLNNKPAPPTTPRNGDVGGPNSKQETSELSEYALSRGEINLKMLKMKIVIPVPKKSSVNLEVGANLNKLKEKRNLEFEKKQLADAELAQSAKLAKIKSMSGSSFNQGCNALRSPLMAPKVKVLTNPKVDFGMLEKAALSSVGTKVQGQKNASPPSIPRLMPGNGFIDLNDPIPRNRRESAKLTAMKFAKSHGGFKKVDPNATTRAADSVPLKRKREQSPDPSEEQSRAADQAAKMKFKEMLETKSRHSGLLEAHDDKEKEDYFNKLEKKEQLEEKMMSTFEVNCKAITCLECKYTSFSAAEICKADGHPLKVRDAVKRFFKCADCGNRTVVLTRIPKTSCSKCRSSHWKRAAMMKERKTESVPLSIRGAEEKYVGSHSGGNINLLVPMS